MHADGETFVALKGLGLLLVRVGRAESCLGAGGDGGQVRGRRSPAVARCGWPRWRGGDEQLLSAHSVDGKEKEQKTHHKCLTEAIG